MLLHHIFESEALRHPDRVAIEYREERITYGELDASANQLANLIKNKHDSGSGVVALSLEKDPSAVTAVLAVLKAGLTWVPLPLDAPSARIQDILKISSPELVLCSQTTAHMTDGLCEAVVLDEPATRERIQQQPQGALPAADEDREDVGSTGLCHILFTSGSTGIPKGVMLEHRAAVHNVQVLANRFCLNELTRTLQFSAYTFDIFGLDLFMTFYVGGCLVMGALADLMSDLTGFISRARITYAQITPTIISLIDPTQAPRSLRVLASTGEPLTAKILHQWAGRARLINSYGPTETIVCTVQEMSTAAAEPQLIGTALPGLDVVLIQEDGLEEVAPGSVGELCVAGVQLFRGYIGVDDDSRTGKRFRRGSQLFYRTGDLGVLTHLADSAVPSIRLLGRKDGQVKVNGVRIDLGEVETALGGSHPHTRGCAAMVPKTGLAGGRISAVISMSDPVSSSRCRPVRTTVLGMNILHATQPEHRVWLTELMSLARSRLPPQAVPSNWWIVDEFPLTSSGKLDRMSVSGWLEGVSERELTEHAQSWAAEQDKQHESQINGQEDAPSQRKLIEICSGILGLSSAGINPRVSLLQLGLSSLGVFQLVSMARREGLEISVEQVLRERSIRQLSLSLSRAERKLQALDDVVDDDVEAFSLIVPPPGTSMQEVKVFVAEQCRVIPDDVLDVYPCTPQQSGMMALAARRSDAYICEIDYPIPPHIDAHQLWSAWESLLLTTPVLRNRVVPHIRGNGLLQATIRHAEVSGSEKEFEAPMSFGDNLCRGRISRDEMTQTCRFTLRAHHAVFDGWTKDLIMLELGDIYSRLAVTSPRASPSNSATSFTRYVKYVVQDMTSREAEHVSFWRKRLEGCTLTDFPRVPHEWVAELTAAHGVLVRSISADVSGAALEYHVTATTLVQAAWAIVLGRQTATADVVFGSTLSGRDAPVEGIGSIIGPTMMTVPCRVRWDDTTTTVSQLLHQLGQESIDLIQHQHYGLQNIARIGQDAKAGSLFRSLLVVQPEPESASAWIKPRRGQHEGFLLEQQDEFDSGVLRTYPLAAELVLSGSATVKVKMHHDQVAVSEQAALRVLGQLEAVLRAIGSAGPDTRIGDIDVWSDDERDRAMATQPLCPPRINRLLHHLVQETAAKYPDHVAVIQQLPPLELSYRQLDRSSTALARHLQHNYRMGRGQIVPIAFEKSALAIIAMLAVLKTGAAYVALDASQPARHLARITETLTPKHALCSALTYPKMRQVVGKGALEIGHDMLSESHSSAVTVARGGDASPDDTAVIFFTSGTTGQPKCIASRHSAVSTSMYHIARALRIEPGARVFQSTSFTFDMSLKDIYCALLSGACICLPNDADRLSAEQMRQMDVGIAFLTPSVAEAIDPRDVPTLRVLNLGGERVTVTLIRRWAGQARLVISYGPTESIACITLADGVGQDADPADMGQPVTGQVWLVRRDSAGSLVPAAPGCIGEIAISGYTVARGYLSDAARSAECFVEKPTWVRRAGGGDDDSRLYLTGDLATRDEAGRILIQGRNDAQIKINGIRIDPADAEYALGRLGGIFSSAVVDAARQPLSMLVAFVRVKANANAGEESSFEESSSASLAVPPDAVPETFAAECRSAQRRLSHQVPQHLIPKLFIPVRAIPLAVSGKTDRRRLQDTLEIEARRGRFAAAVGSKRAWTPSLSTGNARLCAIWQETLARKKTFAPSDNFFREGGDSLVAIRLALACRQQGLQITVAQIHENPTLERMAAVVVEMAPEARSAGQSRPQPLAPFCLLAGGRAAVDEIVAEAAEICRVDAQSVEDVYPASPFQEGLAAINLQDQTAYMARCVYSFPRTVQLPRLEHALEVAVARNPIFRTALAHTSGGTVQVVIGMAAWKRRRLASAEEEDRVSGRTRLEGNASLFQYQLYARDQGDEDKAYLQVDMHHVLYDEWTIQSLLSDLAYNYSHPDAERPGRPPYVNFICQLALMKERTHDDALLTFWNKDLEGSRELEFPRRPPHGRSFKTDSVVRSSNPIPPPVERPGFGTPAATPAAVAAASLAVVLSSYGRTEDVTFGLTLSGRQVAGLEDVAGPTISTVPLRTHVSGGQHVSALVASVQSKMLRVQEFQHADLRKIARIGVGGGGGAKSAGALRTLLVVQHGGAARSEEDKDRAALQLRAVEDETSISLNYGLVVILRMDGPTRQATFVVEFDSSCLDAQQAREVLGRLDRVTRRLSSMEGLVNDALDHAEDGLQRDDEAQDGRSCSSPKNIATTITAASAPATNRSGIASREPAQQHELREELRRLWAEALGISSEHIGPNDSINSLGGDSITLIRLLSAARRRGISLSFGPDMNQFATLADMVAATDEGRDVLGAAAGSTPPGQFSLIEGSSDARIREDAAAKCGVDPASVVDVYPCTPLQEGLMALSVTEPGSYVAQHSYELPPDTCQSRLEAALGRVSKAEAILRTRIFIASGLETRQVVLDNDDRGCRRHHLTLREYVDQDRWVPFGYGRPLTRFALVVDDRGQKQAAYLVISQHHAVSDGWAARLLQAAIESEYGRGHAHQRVAANKPNRMPAFVKFVEHVERSGDAARFWRDTLAGARTTEFPPLTQHESFRATGQVVDSCLTPALPPGIPFTALLEAAWGLVLGARAGCDDVCFGVVRSGRMVPVDDIETMMGPTVATTVCRVQMRPMLPVGRFLDEVAASSNKAVPFEQYGLPNIRRLGGDARAACAFRTMLVVQPEQEATAAPLAGRFAMRLTDEGSMLDNYGLTLDCQPRRDRVLLICVAYGKSSTSDDDARLLMGEFIRAITQLAEGTERLLRDVDISQHHQDGLESATHPSSYPVSRVDLAPVDILRRMWAHVLNIEAGSVRADDDFLMLGGDSISAVKLSSYARQQGISLPARSILRYPDLEQMALQMRSDDRCMLETRDGRDTAVPNDGGSGGGGGSSSSSSKGYAAQISAAYGIPEQEIEQVYPCTPQQVNLMALTLRLPGAYVATESFRLITSTDVARFKEAWRLVYLRHEMLRTRLCQVFDEGGDAALVQVVCAAGDAAPWHGSTEEETVGLGTPLCRFSLVQTAGDHDTHFRLTRHHSIYDGWSTELLLRDLKHAYASGNSPPPRPRFCRYVEHLQTLDRTAVMDFWKRELDGFRAGQYPRLLGDYHDSSSEEAGPGSSSVGLTCRVDRGVGKAISRLGFQHVARAAWALVLVLVDRWPSQTHDVCFGSVVSGRTEPVVAIEDMAGPTMSTVPVRVRIDTAEPVTQYLQRVREGALAMTGFEHMGLSDIGRISDDAAAACRFWNLLVVQPPELESASAGGGLEGICEAVRSGEAMPQAYRLVVECARYSDDSGFRLDASFLRGSQDEGEEAEVRTLLGSLSRIITLLSQPPGHGTATVVSDIIRDAAGADAYKQMLSFNGGPALQRSSLCLHETFERSAMAHPRRTAVLAHDQELTYAALDETAGLLADYLRQELGVGRGCFVPLCFEKSCLVVIAMLAVMKVGAAYVPLDPSHPPARLQHIVQQCRSSLILVSSAQEARMSQATAVQILTVDTSLLERCRRTHGHDTSTTSAGAAAAAAAAARPPGAYPAAATPHDIAYVIFTSGSTGRPKGVLMEHGSVAQNMLQYARVFGYASGDAGFRVLQFSSYAFDVSVAEIFSTLAFGGTVCVPGDEDRLNDLAGAMTAMEVDVAFLTPTVAGTLPPGRIPTLKVLCLTGEAIPSSLLRAWAAGGPLVKLFNAYGPTEAAVHCAAGQLRPDKTGHHRNIGSPFGGQIWIVDPEDHTRLRPVCCPGEMVVSGPTLARGYLDDAEQTARAFVSGIVWAEGAEPRSIYKTGDVARYRGDGTLEFLGRKDGQQVKFHGLRIELGEIEAAIHSSCDGARVLTGVVVEKLVILGRDSLVAFFHSRALPVPTTMESEAQPCLVPPSDIPRGVKALVRTIVASLETLLPRYMIPSLFLPVSRWSQNTSGKTDRQLLRDLARGLDDTAVDMYRNVDDDDNSQALDVSGDNRYMGGSGGDSSDSPHNDGRRVARKESLHVTPGDGLNGDPSLRHAQELVIRLWAKVLGRGPGFRPGPDRDFLSSGGDSVSAVFLAAEFRREGIPLSVSDIYHHANIASMAGLVISHREPGRSDKPTRPHVVDVNMNLTWDSKASSAGPAAGSGGPHHLRAEAAAELGISPDAIQDIYPCTPLQEGTMFLSERVEGSYHARFSVLMPRRLDPARLHAAIRSWHEMHDILRTRIVFHDTLGSMQVVLTDKAHHALEAERRSSPDEAAKPVRLGYGLPLHQHALVARDSRIYLQLDCHHAVYDGWSLPLLIEDLSQLYRDAGYPLRRQAPTPFKDLIAYMHDPSVVEAADGFWARYLQGAAVSDFPELAGRTHNSIRADAYLERRISLRADGGRAPEGRSLATVLAAAWSLVVSRHTASHDVCFGLVVSGRSAPVPGIEGIRGPAINTVPFRVALDHQTATVADALEQVQAHLVHMMPHQFASLTRVRKAFPDDSHGQFGSLLSIQTGTRGSLGLQHDDDMPRNHDAESGSDFSICAMPDGGEKLAIFGEPYPLFLGVNVDPESGCVVVGAQYDPSVVDADNMARILGQYENAIRQLATADEPRRVRLRDVELLTESDRRCLVEWAGKAVEPGDVCVHEMIEDMAASHPHHQAIEGLDESLTYGQLARQADLLASHLLGLCGGTICRDMTIPVWMETSPTAVVAILAVLKLGASYAPLDHRIPVTRAEYIVGDLSASVLLASREKSHAAAELADGLGESRGKALAVVQVHDVVESMVCVLEDKRKPSHMPSDLAAAKPSDLAYVIYTSGSTGQPKGVMMEHWALTATVREQALTYGFDARTRMFGLASLSWDPSLLEIFAVLCHGGCLCIPTEDERGGSADLVDSINRHRADQISTSPAVASLIDLRATPTVRAVSLGGEVMREENVANAHEAGVRLFNIYGPSEACIDAVVHRNVVPGVSPRNIGRPMSSQVWIVDPADPRRLVPPGCPGELALSGTLARGYLNDEAKTARSFLVGCCPFASPVYLTGDLGRYESDGSICFLGRKDRQVKLNGQRVELGDIEDAVRTACPHDDVAVDHFSVSEQAKKLLVVYLSRPSSTAHPSSPPPLSEGAEGRDDAHPVRVLSWMRPDSDEFQHLQGQLRKTLPRYMVPRIFVSVSRVPLSLAGKVDVKPLRAAYAGWVRETSSASSQQPQPDPSLGSVGTTMTATSRSEMMLRGLWASALGCAQESIRPRDDMFDLGADSLTVIKVAMLARRKGYSLSVAQIYASPVLSQMASLLSSGPRPETTLTHHQAGYRPFSLLSDPVREALQVESDDDSHDDEAARTFVRGVVVDAFPCSHFQAAAIAQSRKAHKAFYAWFLVRIRGAVDLEHLQAACDLLVRRHATLRTSYRIVDGESVQQVHASSHAASDFAQLGPCRSEDDFVAQLDRAADPFPVRLGRIPTRFRTAAYRSDEQGGYLLAIGMSHAQYDGFCWARIMDDLHHAYLSGTLHDHEPPPYSRFINHSLDTSRDPRCESFWTRLLGSAGMTSLSQPAAGGSQPWLPLGRKQMGTLPRYKAPLGSATFAVVVKAAWSLVLSWLSGTHDLVFGSLVFGRNPQIDGIEDVVGACLNVVPNRISLLDESVTTVADLLELIQQQQISIVPFETTSLPEISRYVGWPTGTRFGSVVQHQNIDEDVFAAEAAPQTSRAGRDTPTAAWSFAGSAAYPGICDDVLDCWIVTVPRPEETRLSFQYSDATIPDDAAAEITRLLCHVIRSIYADPSRPLPIASPPAIISSISTQIQRVERSDEKMNRDDSAKLRLEV